MMVIEPHNNHISQFCSQKMTVGAVFKVSRAIVGQIFTSYILCSNTNIGPVAPMIIMGCPPNSPNRILQAQAAKITSVKPSQPSVLSSNRPPKAIFVANKAKYRKSDARRV